MSKNILLISAFVILPILEQLKNLTEQEKQEQTEQQQLLDANR